MTAMPAEDAERLAEYCLRVLPLTTARLGEEFGYQSLALCVIDAVWSVGVRYEGVTNVIRRYCDYLGSTPETRGFVALRHLPIDSGQTHLGEGVMNQEADRLRRAYAGRSQMESK